MSEVAIEIERARALRKNMTDAERRSWSRLRRRQIHGRRFRRQHPIGPFIADFACVDAKLVIELDGAQHALRKDEDGARTRRLSENGYSVLRFWNNDVLTQTDAVVFVIANAIQAAPLPSPPPLASPRASTSRASPRSASASPRPR